MTEERTAHSVLRDNLICDMRIISSAIVQSITTNKAPRVYASIWTEGDLESMYANMAIFGEVTEDHLENCIDQIFHWMNSSDSCNDPMTYDRINSYFELLLRKGLNHE